MSFFGISNTKRCTGRSIVTYPLPRYLVTDSPFLGFLYCTSTLRALPSEPGKVFETIPSRHRPLIKLESCIKSRSPVVRLRYAVWTGTDNTEMAEEAKSIRWTAKARFTRKRNELLKSMDADQGREMVEGNYVKLSEAWDSNVSKAKTPTASRETVGKTHFSFGEILLWNTLPNPLSYLSVNPTVSLIR